MARVAPRRTLGNGGAVRGAGQQRGQQALRPVTSAVQKKLIIMRIEKNARLNRSDSRRPPFLMKHDYITKK